MFMEGKMTDCRAADILQEYNAWRHRSYDAVDVSYTPDELTEALELAVKALKPKLKPTLDNIAAAVLDETGITMDDLLSVNRYRDFAEARWMVAWIGYSYANASTPRLARFLNRSNHSTVLHGIKFAREWMENPILNPEWVRKTKKIIEKIKYYHTNQLKQEDKR